MRCAEFEVERGCPVNLRDDTPSRMARRSGLCATALALACCQTGSSPAPKGTPPRVAAVQPTVPGAKVFPLERAAALEHQSRDAWQRPDEVVALLAIVPGERIADVGCGTGYFTFRLADATGPGGRVIAVDIQQGMLDIVAARMGPAYQDRIELRLSEASRPLEPTDALDLVFCANTLHEVDDAEQQRFVERLAAGLRPGGRLALINWRPLVMSLGPPLPNRIPADRVRTLATAAGLVLEHDHDLLPTHSFLVFRKAGGSR